MNPIIKCTKHSVETEQGVQIVMQSITASMTDIEFDNIRARFPNHRLEHGGYCCWNPLGRAAYLGNSLLVRHIVNIGGKHLLNFGNQSGWTPLFCAAYNEDRQTSFLTAKELLKLGAYVNLATSCWAGKYNTIETPEGATPLWAAAERSKNPKLIKLLLKNGGLVSHALSEQGQAILNTVLEELATERKVRMLILAGRLKDGNVKSPFSILPLEIIANIFKMVFYDPELSLK